MMEKVRGKWYVYWWNPNSINAYPKVVASDFDTKENGHEWIVSQGRYQARNCDVRYHDTIEEVIASMEKKMTSDFLDDVNDDLLIRCLKLLPEGQAVLDLLEKKIADDKPKWRKMLEEKEWSNAGDLDFFIYG